MDVDGTIKLVGAILRGTPSLPGAACRGRYGLFDEVPGTAVAARQERARAASALCSRCPARPACPQPPPAVHPVSRPGERQLVAGRTADAVVRLHRALDQLDYRAGKPRSVVLLDLAAAHAVTDAEHGMDFAAQAFDQLEREPYGTAHGRIPAVRRAREGTPQAWVLDERVRSLPAVG